MARVSRSRLEAFSDGVFAIAITLLVLTIAQPATADYARLARFLLEQWPGLAAYVVSFAVIGIMWLNHHTIFENLASLDRGFFYLNLVLLMTIAFLPYPTGVFGNALHHGHGARAAAVFYSATMAVNAYVWSALWFHASRHRRLLVPAFPEEQRRLATVAFTGGSAVYTLTVGVAFINAYACLAVHGGLAVYYALDPLSRAAVRQRRTDGPDDGSDRAGAGEGDEVGGGLGG
jgi:TMEM175 potassium channel family protein